MNKKWIVRERIPEKVNKELEQWPELVRHLLFYRGIKTKKEAEKFLNPDYEKHLHDPFGMLDMDKAVERILKAIKNNEKIVIFGDYDADGVCSSAIFYEFFKKIDFKNHHFHIPDRHLEGYGLTQEAINEFIEQKFNLIITLDCGITDVKEVGTANTAGIDVIIADHHLPPKKLPDAYAIIDSKQEKDKYPFKDLCGAGVAFKVVHALIIKGNESLGWHIIPGWEKWLLDLVAIATVADMVPLVDENRTLVFYGLKVLEKTNRTGLLSFFRRFEINPKNINEDDIAFMIAPRINIASRMDHANSSFNLLITESSGEANWIAGHLEGLNNDRRVLVDKIMDEIDEKIKKEGLVKVIVEGDASWNPGVLSILANRLVENYNCPVFLWGKGEAKEIKGSGRSDGSINLVDLMNFLPKGLLAESGGHAFAAGFTLKEGKESEFKNEIIKAYKKADKAKTENGFLHIDKEISIDEINWEFYEKIESLKPFGADNPKPVFLFSGIEIFNVRKFGNSGLHLQLDFKNSIGDKFSAIGFFMNGDKFMAGQKIDLVASLEKSTFRNSLELRLRIIDANIKS
ncbi:MAG: single-stranded-DNA-specific exonuclease RecJ [Patescibacteria group bacterium]